MGHAAKCRHPGGDRRAAYGSPAKANIKHKACSCMPFLHSLNKEHSLGTQKRQANGMLVSLIFLYIKWSYHCH